MFVKLSEEDISFILLCLFILLGTVVYYLDYRKRKVLQDKVFKRTLYYLDKREGCLNEYFTEFIVEDAVGEILKRRKRDIKTIDTIIKRVVDDWYGGYECD